MKKTFVVFMAFLCFIDDLDAGQIRTVKLNPNQIGQIRLAKDFCTLVQVPTKKFKLVSGKPEALEIVYDENTFLIKPKVTSFQTNIFVLTDGGRFNLHIVVTAPARADEVVYLEFRPSN